MCSILSFAILTKIYLIYINHVYLKFSTMFLLISVNMIYTNEAEFRSDTKWQDTAHWVTPFCHFILLSELLSGERSQILRDARYELLNIQKNPIGSQCNAEYPASCGEL